MKPPDFRYHRPASVDEAVALLARLAPDAKVIAGGQSLMPLLNMRMLSPAHLVDINFAAGFPGLELRDGVVEVGALVRQSEVEDDAAVRDACPLLAQALAHVAHRPIRFRGTVAGSVAHADPAAELPAVLALLGGTVVAHGPRGMREIAAEDFFVGWFETALAPDELVVAVRFPALAAGERCAFVELARRSGDYALSAVAAVVDGSRARVSLTGVGARPHVHDVSGLLAGDDGVLDDLAAALEPADDIHASADYRRHVARELTRRAVASARGANGDGA